jgi:UPF0755 protein
MKKIIALFLSLFGALGIFLSWQVISFLSAPAQLEAKEVIFEIPNGTAFYHVAQDLEDKGLVQDAHKFSWLAKFMQQTTRLKVGEYKLNTNMRPREVLSVLVSGHSISYPLTIPEGQNIYEIRDQLNNMWAGRGDEFMAMVTNQEFIKQLTGEKLASLEGYLYPDTYALTKYTTVETLVRRMYDHFQETIATVNKSAKLQMPLHDQVILASVIEKETGAPGDRQLISSVFHNRMQKGMRLESDPTILYGILVNTKVIKKNITKTDIHTPTPYNTYTVKGLPEGPISNPGKDALWAALNPVESKYLFFVSRNDGTTYFAESYKEHTSAVQTYQVDKKGRTGKSWRDLKKAKN